MKKQPPATRPPNNRNRWAPPRGLSDFLAVLFCFLVLSWLITLGDWEFFPPGGTLETFFDAQAHSLLEGRIDVPADSLYYEAFVRGGKYYGYFGPTPALARLPLELLLPAMHGRWSRASVLASSLLAMLLVLLFFRRLERYFELEGRRKLCAILRATAIVAVALGSTNPFLCAESKVYQEAIAWGAALTLAQAVFLFFYLIEPRSRWLALTCAAAFLAFFARATSGAGALAALAIADLAILLPSVRLREYWGVVKVARRPAAIAMSATLLASAVCWAGLNYAKWGVFFASTPIQFHVQYDAARLARNKGELVSLENLPMAAACYLWPGNIRFVARFPWVYLAPPDPGLSDRFPKAHFDGVEPFSSLPVSMPGLLLGGVCGTLLCFAPRWPNLRTCRAPLAGAFAGGMAVFVFGYITYRYLDDLRPWLALGSVIALVRVPLLKSDRLRRAIVVLAILLTAYSVWTNFAFAIVQQRFYAFFTPQEKRMAFEDFADAVSAGGPAAMLSFPNRWRKYVDAVAVIGGSNLKIDRSTGRIDQPVLASKAAPARAEYIVHAAVSCAL